MFGYSYRLRVALLALGVLFGYGSAIAHLAGHRHCMESDWSWDGAPWSGHHDRPPGHGAPASNPVQ